ncbi:ATP-binding protein [Methylocapsa palsarum]|uniref:AAA ATPase domain-containing protein n=1 Tax=Methylocapsa palsarum TaxID=1612308 RepID=A0A1I3YD84_9HYPH|nr:AAA family ATPase [Methylocapsa palsarum]SFK29775.1 AAA ATPase domain-containing protein [Methylocapsa palsarum]
MRIALGDDPKAPRYIETVTRRGYRFIAPVSGEPKAEADEKPEPEPQRQLRQTVAPARWHVGRAGPLKRLDEYFELAVAGDRQLAFITGEAGIGKTTFLEMFVERKVQARPVLLWCRCVEHFGTDEAFLPLIEALQDHCRGAGGPGLVKTLRLIAPTWLAQLTGFLEPNDRADLQNEIFGATRERMLREFCELVEFLSLERPWLIIIEDLHWSDYATLDVLSLFAQRQQRSAALVLATYRPVDVVVGGHPALTVHQELQIHGRCTELALEKLSLAEVRQYLGQRFGDVNLGETVAEQIYARTGGQPLFVVSLVDYFVAQGEIREVDGKWRLAPDGLVSQDCIPHDLRAMIGRQLDRLDPVEQRALEAASAAGAEFSAALVAGALESDALDVEQVFERLARKGQVIAQAGVAEWPDGTVAGHYSFLHALFQEVLSQRLAPGQKVRLHRRLGERLEIGYGARTAEVASLLAIHFEEGRDFSKAIRYLGEAAESSAKRFGNREVVVYVTRALDLVSRLSSEPPLELRMKLLQQRGWARRSAGDLRGALQDLTAVASCAAQANQPLAEVKALMDLSRFCVWVDRRRCLDLAERAVVLSRTLGDQTLTILAEANWSSLRLYLKGWRDEDAARSRVAVQMMGQSQDPRTEMRRCGIVSTIELITSNYRECFAAADRCQQLAQDRGDVYFYVIYNTFLALSLLQLGEWREMKQRLAAALTLTERNANKHVSGMCHLMIAWLHAEALDFEGARKRCEEALDLAVEENPVNFFLGRNILVKIHLGLRDYPAAFDQLTAITRRIETDGVPMESVFHPFFFHSLSEYWLGVGDTPRAKVHALQLSETAARPPENAYLALSHRLLARIAVAEGDMEQAKGQLAKAIAIVEVGEMPIAAWRVCATAAEFYESVGETDKAVVFRRRCDAIIQTLAATFDEADPLRSSLVERYASPLQ